MPEYQQDNSNRAGGFELKIRFAEHTPDADAKWMHRVDALADLLLVLWEEQQRQEAQAA